MTANREQGTLYIVATPIGNLGDITSRAVDVMRSVDEVWAEDTRHSSKLLNHLGVSAKLVACHDHNEALLTEQLVEKLAIGCDVALISDAGTPLISDPGYKLVSICRERGFRVSPVPGASALIAALSVSGLPTDSFIFEGFPPSKSLARKKFFKQLINETRTLIFLESSHRINESLNSMREQFGNDRKVVVARELTKLHETVLVGCLSEICATVDSDDRQRKGEFVVVINGADKGLENNEVELRRVIGLLLPEMSVKRAAGVAAEITGIAKNTAYSVALKLNQRK